MSGADSSDGIAVVTGCIGAVTGLASLALSVITYRRANRTKALELQLELRKATSAVQNEAIALFDLLARAGKSRSAVLAARGLGRSGAETAWQTQIQTDIMEATRLHGAAADLPNSDRTRPDEETTAALAAVHDLQLQVSGLTARYQAELAQDDEARRQLARAAAERSR
ncbi:hypothetical protein QCE73_00165 [Caballeronia sp. LZ029]|uniref:hypothetical protein n=1 Tax=Caballeronia sp. LZ029 TaxID=3038564 RepID=UPI002866D70F|nr:hypothetical protein [Caballeronia sp. LZ029]MDR5741561.1 hypothetical protein [Caballeronia sp. LZ029]